MALVYPLDFIGSPILTPPHAGLVAIYGLFEPQTDELRYIGKATAPLERYRTHLHSAKRFKRTHVTCWVRGLYEQGLKPVMHVLAWVERAEWSEAERAYITEGKRLGLRLTNLHPGGRGSDGYVARPEVRVRLGEIQRRIQRQRPEIVLKRIASTKRTYADDPAREQRRYDSVRRAYADPAVRARVAEAVSKHIAEHPDYWAHVKDGLARANARPEVRARKSEGQRRRRERERQERVALEVQGIVPPTRTQSAETKAKRSASLRAYYRQPEARRQLAGRRTRRPLTPEHKAAMAEGRRRARRRTEEGGPVDVGTSAPAVEPAPCVPARPVQLRLPGT